MADPIDITDAEVGSLSDNQDVCTRLTADRDEARRLLSRLVNMVDLELIVDWPEIVDASAALKKWRGGDG